MPKTPSTIGLHLSYRIWIAEMNADLTVLRIFDDYLAALPAVKKDPQLKALIEDFKKQFADLRQEIDELKHDMHLQKMKLAATTRAGKAIDENLYVADNHELLKQHYEQFRAAFSKMKTDFRLLSYN